MEISTAINLNNDEKEFLEALTGIIVFSNNLFEKGIERVLGHFYMGVDYFDNYMTIEFRFYSDTSDVNKRINLNYSEILCYAGHQYKKTKEKIEKEFRDFLGKVQE